MKNPLQPPIMRLFERLAFLNGLLLHLKNQCDNYFPLLKKSFEQQNLDPSLMAAGFALGIRDLTQPVDSFRGHYPIGVSVSRNLDEYQHTLEEILSRNCAWAVAQGYEAFEAFLKDTTAIYVQENFASIAPTALKKLTPKEKKLQELARAGFTQTDFEYWRRCIVYTSRDNKVILSKIRNALVPRLRNVEVDNKTSIDFIRWFDIVTEVRHAVTHSNGIIKSQKQNPNWAQHILSTYFPGKVISDGYELKLTVESAGKNVEAFAEYGYVIFKCLSDQQNYAVNIFS